MPPRLLVAAHAFPETGGARVDRLVRWLPSHGIAPVVLCARESDGPLARAVLGRDHAADLPVHRARTLAPTPFAPRFLVRGTGARGYALLRWLSLPERLLLVPDYKVGWIPAAIRTARRLWRRGAIDAVLTSSPPESTHLIGLYLRRCHGVPWVADFRDLWTEKGLLCRPPTALHAAAIRAVERRCFLAADHVVANTPENAARHVGRFGLAAGRVTVVPNGFDPCDLAGHRPAPSDGVFRVGYMGHFDKHGFPWRPFLEAFRRFADTAAGPVRLVHCGFQSAEVRAAIDAMGLAGRVDALGSREHRAAVHAMADTDALCSLLYENAYSDAIVNAKLYVYLGLGKPILAVGPRHGAVARVLDETGAGVAVSAAEGADAAADVLRGWHAAWRAGRPATAPDAAAIARYDVRGQTAVIAGIVRKLVGRGRRAEAPVPAVPAGTAVRRAEAS